MAWRTAEASGWGSAIALALVVGCSGSEPPSWTGGDTGDSSTGLDAASSGASAGGEGTSSASSLEGSGMDSTDDNGKGDESSGSTPVDPGTGAPYPIVLAHGFFGFDDFAGAGFLDYFWEVLPHLAQEGEALVFTTTVDPFNNSLVRGQQLLAKVEAIIAQTGAAKVNIIGHSQGGIDARFVASLRPDLVASVTTIATPHYGTRLADIVLGFASDPDAEDIIDMFVQLAGTPLWDEVGEETSLMRSLEQLSEVGMAEFNQSHPNQPGVRYFSLTGRSSYHGGGAPCAVDDAPDFITDFANDYDPVDPLFYASAPILSGYKWWDPNPNDGLVLVESAKWGTFLGCIPADHLDEIGQLFGAPPGTYNEWRHLPFYADLVGFLRAQGL